MSRPRAGKADRALARLAHQQRQRGDYDEPSLTDAVAAKLALPAPKSRRRKGVAKGFPASDVSRWVPIGPSVVRQGQGTGRPRVTGRIRDLAVSPDGTRVYAASARGGVWFSGDGGSTWAPVGGWAERPVGSGGANNAQSCGALLVSFGATAADDLVLVGTGEGVPFVTAVAGQYGGVGVLAALGPAVKPVGDNPWEAESGLGLLRGLGVMRLARDPASTPGSTVGASTDRVLAATSDGLYLGTRQAAPLQYTWARLPGPEALMAVAPTFTTPSPPAWAAGSPVAISDVAWIGGRIVIAVNQRGLAFSDDGGATFAWLGGCNWPVSGQTVQGLSSIALAPGTSTLYALTGLRRTAGLPANVDDDTALFTVPDITVAAPAATRVTGVPTRLWPGQRDYDQALAVDVVTDGTGTHHNVYLGGSFTTVGPTFDASLWCFQVGTGHKLAAAPGVSRTGTANEGAVAPGHIGVGVHADVHAIEVNVLAGGRRQVWVGCDGGVYASGLGGRAYTFQPRNTGLAVLEAGFSATHPRLSHLAVAGLQDNGTQLRNGDTVWEEIFEGDGGGVAFDPVQPHRVVGQYIRASWSASPGAGFQSPTSRIAGGGTFVGDREDTRGVSEFYSGAATTVSGAGATRLAVGTNRVWLCDDLGTAAVGSWRALPFPGPGPARDVRPNGTDPSPRFGVPAGALTIPAMAAGATTGPLGNVVALKWSSPTVLVVLFQYGVVVWTEAPAGTWTAAFTADWTTFAGSPTFTDIAPVPGTGDFYLTTTGDAGTPAEDTCFLWDGASGTLVPTRLRNVLDTPAPVVPGPLDPAYAAVVDPANPLEVYIGTVTGVWHGVRTAGTTTVTWGATPFVNGLPQAAVQDLTIHFDPASPNPRLLRAAVQSRGVWEVDLAAANEPARTYLRVHPYDDRRRLPVPLADPRKPVPPLPAPAPVLRADASPDITVRPRSGAGIAPTWQLGTSTITAAKMTAPNAPTYQLWTFQTAFRWLYPSVLPTGRWSRPFEQLVRVQRAISTPGSPGAFIDKALWDAVVATRIDPATGLVSANAAHPLAVYQPPWLSPTAMAAGATEIDLVECVVPPGAPAGVWTVHREPSTVEVLLHHRDTRPLLGGEAHGALLWRSDPLAATLLGLGTADLVTFLGQCALTGNVAAAPGGWSVAGPAAGAAALSLGTGLDARIPRALSFDVDLSGVNAGDFVLFAAVAWSEKDKATVAPSLPAAPAVPTVVDLARGWPYLALRLVQVTARPA